MMAGEEGAGGGGAAEWAAGPARPGSTAVPDCAAAGAGAGSDSAGELFRSRRPEPWARPRKAGAQGFERFFLQLSGQYQRDNVPPSHQTGWLE